jgi:hypothetical protein
LSFGQIKLIAETWENVVLVGDHQDKADGTENRVQAATVNALLGAGVREVHLVKLPHGDPGSWERSEFFRFIAEDIKRSRVLSP